VTAAWSGVGPAGNLSAYQAFGLDSAERTALLIRHHRVLLDAWAGRPLQGGDRLYPPIPAWWIASGRRPFSVEGARRAGAAGDGLMLSRTQRGRRRRPTCRCPTSSIR